MKAPLTIWNRAFSAILCILLFQSASAFAEQVSVSAIIDKDEVFYGDSVRLEINVGGSNSPSEPDLSKLTDFSVQKLSAGPRNETSVFFDGTRTVRNVKKRYVSVYSLTPKRVGVLRIPPLTLTAEGSTLVTAPLNVTVQQPTGRDDFQLSIHISRTECYVGEPVLLTLRLLFKKSIERAQMIVPILDDTSCDIADPYFGPSEKRISVPATGGTISGTRSTGRLKGEQVSQILFKKILIPSRAGTIDIPAAVFDGQVLTGYRNTRDPFGFFSNSRRGVYERFQVPSGKLTLRVLPLPSSGRPAGFSGPALPGLKVAAAASVSEVNIGDPITLTVTLSSSPYVQHVNLPDLASQKSIAEGFRVPKEIEDGTARGRDKVYVQTIRATTADIDNIPAIQVPYFNTRTHTYEVATSSDIPLTVKHTRIVGVTDAEGNGGAVAGAALRAWAEGIAHNYTDESVLEPREYGIQALFRSPLWTCAMVCPPALFLLALLVTLVRVAYFANPEALRSRRAHRAFRRSLAAIENPGAGAAPAILDELRRYFGARLGRQSAALSIADIRNDLVSLGVREDDLHALEEMFARCEAGAYAGADVTRTLRDDALRAVAAVDQVLSSKPSLRTHRSLILAMALVTLASTSSMVRAQALGTQPTINAQAPEILLQEANDLFRQANEVADSDAHRAGELYYASARKYERIITEWGIRNGSIYCNIGNAYFRGRDIGRAILNYRRAQLYSRGNSDLERNLAYARSRRLDRIEEKPQKQILRTLLFWHYDLSTDARARVFAVCYLICWISAIACLFSRRRRILLRVVMVTGFVSLSLVLSIAAEEIAIRNDPPGVIVAREVIARKGDGDSYEKSFTEPLHAGVEVRLIEARERWLHVELRDGERCWVPRASIELVKD